MSTSLSRLFFFLAGGASGALLVAWFFAPGVFVLPAGNAATASSTSWPAPSGDVDVVDQPAGNSVAVASVTVRPPGVWVVVTEVNEDDSLGNALGAQFVGGPRSDVRVALLRDTVPHHAYAVVLYRDKGDGRFAPDEDSVYVDFDTGQPAQTLFHTK